MALTQQQEAWIGVYGQVPHVVNRFFTRRIKKGKIPFITNMETINFEQVEKFARKAKILQRGAEFPMAKLNGSRIMSVVPEVIKDSFPFYPTDQLNRQPGEVVYVNGQKVDNRTYERDRRIAGLKQSIDTVTEEISASVFLKGLYKSQDTGNEVKFGFPFEYKVAKADIKDFGIWVVQKVNEFTKDNKVRVSEILIGEKVFFHILETYNKSSNKVIPVEAKKVSTEDGDYELHLNLFGFDFVMIPQVTDTTGYSLDMSSSILLYNEMAYLPTYAGLVNVTAGIATMEAIDVLIRETNANEKTGEAETLGESAYCPIIVNSSLIHQFKISDLT
ncbi:MAG: hypothetical protein ACRC6K_00115 [Fusobacteriaceae bacterium]